MDDIGKDIEEGKIMAFYPDEISKLWEMYKERCAVNREEVVTNSGKIVVVKKPLIPSLLGFYSYARIQRTHAHWMMKQPHYPMQAIRDEVEGYKAEALVNGKGSAAGLIFTLKAQWNWKDKTEQELDQKITIEFKDGASIL